MKKIALILFATIILFASHAQKHAPTYKTLSFNINGCRIDMVYVQGGEFTMGCDEGLERQGKIDEIPFHPVVVGSFYMGRYEVTQRLWKAIMGYNPSNFPDDDRPVEQVSYEEVHTFIQRLNTLSGKHFRLPTEAEWEYAARGGGKGNGCKYSGSNTVGSVAWYFSNKSHPVAGKKPNELGLYDMSGNVYEWCQDVYGDYSGKAQSNPQGISTGSSRVFRGGSWIGDKGSCRVSYRGHKLPGNAENNLGLRLAMDIE